MTQQTKTKYPSAVYAAAGVGDLVYQQLRKLQSKAIEFGSEQAPQWKQKVAEFGAGLDADKVRDTVVTGTQVAAERATKVYGTLVARGEKAFGTDEVPTSAAEATALIAEAPKKAAPAKSTVKPTVAKKAVKKTA